MYFLRLCWKNIWRNRRRTLLTVSAIGIGVMALIWLHNYYDAFHEQCIQNAIAYQSGHLLISKAGYPKEKDPHFFIRSPKKIVETLQKQTEVLSYSARVTLQGLISSSKGSANILFHGIVPEQEKNTTRFASRLIEGTFLQNPRKTRGIVMGRVLSEKLGVKVGSKVVALTQGIDGSIGNELFHVAGIFDTGSDVDGVLAFIRIEDARSLLSLPSNAIHQITVLLKGQEHISKIRFRLVTQFRGESIEVLSWMDVQKSLLAMIDLNKSANRILMMIILAVTAMGIINSILMGLFERKREFGIMLAMGTTQKEIMTLVITETLLLSLTGLLVGNILGIGLTLYFGKFGFDLRWLSENPMIVNGNVLQTVSYPAVHLQNSVLISLVILAASLFIALFPVHHVSKLSAVSALKDP